MKALVKILLFTALLSVAACSLKSENTASVGKEAQAYPLKTPEITSSADSQAASMPAPSVTAVTNNSGNLAMPNQTEAQPTESSKAPAASSMSVSPALKPVEAPAAKTSSDKQLQAGSILLNQPVASSWGKVGSALGASGFEVMQQDRALNAYFVADKKASGGKFAGDTPVLQVKLLPVGQATVVTMQDASGASVSADTLKRLYNNLP